MVRNIFLFLFLSFGFGVTAQEIQSPECPRSIGYLNKNLETDLTYLASDELKGRYPGTAGELMAAEYIAERFQALDMKALVEENFYQPFPINDGVEYTGENFFRVKKKAVAIDEEGYYATQYTSNGEYKGKSVYVSFGVQAPELEYNDYKGKKVKGKAVVINVSSPDGIHPHSKYMKYHDVNGRIQIAKEAGASAVILIDPDGTDMVRKTFDRRIESGIPVIFVAHKKASEKLMKKAKVDLKISVKDKILEARNVVGYIDNKSKQTVIIGAHYDHLGMGGHGSLYRGEPAIHNGADDNASGVAGLLALAEYLKKENPEGSILGSRNYLFIAFSGEEKGLLGSNYFVKSEIMSMIKPSYMLNMDMIGHMDLDRPVLIVNGVGTSPTFQEIVMNSPCVELTVKTTEGGIGPSDHTSFYNQEIPVLHFFTGAHDHYHKPTDDVEIINFMGLTQVLDYMIVLMEQFCQVEYLEFRDTPDENSTKAPRFSVTMGVVPDYAYGGKGMRIDGVTKGKPAEKAGIQKGDVVIELHGMPVVDMMGYMRALGELKSGLKTSVIVQRNGKDISLDIQF